MVLLKTEQYSVLDKLFFYEDIVFEDYIFIKDFSIDTILPIQSDIFIANPTLEELKLLVSLQKNVFLVLDYITYDFVSYLESNFVKKVFVLDVKDKQFLDNIGINKYELIYPLSEKIKLGNNNSNDNKITVLNPIEEIEFSDIENMNKFTELNYLVFYSGLKKINQVEQYEKLIKMIYDNIIVHSHPVIYIEDELNATNNLLSFVKYRFPIEVLFYMKNKRNVFLISPFYKSWLSLESQQIKDYSEKEIETIIEKNYKLFEEYFEARKKINEVIWY